MRALIDMNVIVDVIERRKESFDDSYTVLRIAADGKIEAFILAGSIADVHYIIRKGKDAATARDAIALLLQPATQRRRMSHSPSIGDFEDAILAATARREKAEYIITRNDQDFVKSPILATSPSDFLARFGDQLTGG